MTKVILKNIGVNRWQLERLPGMKVDAIVYVKPELLEQTKKDRSLEQLAQSASLPGVISPVVAMPDVHEGFGLPIGGVMATDNLVSSGAVGMDINCGVRLLASSMEYNEKTFSRETLRILINSIEKLVPVGLGSKHKKEVPIQFSKIITDGAQAVISAKLGQPEDIDSIEEHGRLDGAKMENLSPIAIKRVEKELGTLGSGNHFIEIQTIEKIFQPELAKKWHLFAGQICVMVHTGSRALGHQTCLDYTERFFREQANYGIAAPTKNLASLPADSPDGAAYLSAMAGCVNFAFASRQLITYHVRRVFEHFFKTSKSKLNLLYDVAHNIAKWESFDFAQDKSFDSAQGESKKVLVHRKGATRALPAGHPQNPKHYLETGHPAIVPGSMGTGSYVMVGLPTARETFYSINHGAGRAMSRSEAIRSIKKEEFEQKMAGIIYNQPFEKIVDEAPQAYKNIDLVVETLVEAGIAQKVCRLKPLAVIKGD